MITTLLFLSNLAAAAGQAPDFTLSTKAAKGKLEITAAPPAGHHINVQAPMELEDAKTHEHVKPAAAKPARVVFRLGGTTAHEVIVRLFLCDEKNTYCERHEVRLTAEGHAEAAATAPATTASAAAPSGRFRREHGFIMNDPKAAFAEAARRKAPLLIDFFGIWCPPCNMLDETVFPSKDFAKASSGFVKLKLDSDSPVSWEFKSRYHVTGYPTVVFATTEGEEISRIVGFRPRAEFVAEMRKAFDSRTEPGTALKARADAGDPLAALRVGKLALEREDNEVARTYLAKAEGQPGQGELLADAEVALAEADSPAKLVEAATRALAAHGDAVDAVDWRSKLADAYETLKKEDKMREVLGELIASVDVLITHPEKLAGHDALPADLLATAAEAKEKLGPDGQARAAWKRAAEAYRQELLRAGGRAAEERGFNLELAFCLGKAGEVDEAGRIYGRLEKRYPREFTFYFGHARMEFARKKATEARKLAGKAYEFSYGDNRLRVAELLAKAYAEEGNKPEALRVLSQTLGSAELPSDKTIRTHRYAAKLEELRKKLSAQ